MSNITPFLFDSHQVRVVTGSDGEPWFVASDVASVLGYAEAKDMARSLDDDEKGRHQTPTHGGTQEVTVISEGGLYRAIIQRQTGRMVDGNQKAAIKRFQRWVAHEVIPSIRKSGGYIAGQEEADEEELIAKALQVANSIIERKKAELSVANEKLAKLKPKGEFYDAVTGSKDAIDLGAAAKVLNMGLGRNKLFSLLRQKKVLQENNLPYQEQIDAGRFRVIEQRYSTPNGETHIGMKTVVYQRGLDYIRRKISLENAQS